MDPSDGQGTNSWQYVLHHEKMHQELVKNIKNFSSVLLLHFLQEPNKWNCLFSDSRQASSLSALVKNPFCLSFFCPTKFHLSHSDKELLESENRGESQQEILRRIAKDLPIYTRTNSGGTAHDDARQLEESGLVCGSFRPVIILHAEVRGSCFWWLCDWMDCVFSAIRYCDRCQLLKPDRCHHCSVCDKYGSPLPLVQRIDCTIYIALWQTE